MRIPIDKVCDALYSMKGDALAQTLGALKRSVQLSASTKIPDVELFQLLVAYLKDIRNTKMVSLSGLAFETTFKKVSFYVKDGDPSKTQLVTNKGPIVDEAIWTRRDAVIFIPRVVPSQVPDVWVHTFYFPDPSCKSIRRFPTVQAMCEKHYTKINDALKSRIIEVTSDLSARALLTESFEFKDVSTSYPKLAKLLIECVSLGASAPIDKVERLNRDIASLRADYPHDVDILLGGIYGISF